MHTNKIKDTEIILLNNLSLLKLKYRGHQDFSTVANFIEFWSLLFFRGPHKIYQPPSPCRYVKPG